MALLRGRDHVEPGTSSGSSSPCSRTASCSRTRTPSAARRPTSRPACSSAASSARRDRGPSPPSRPAGHDPERRPRLPARSRRAGAARSTSPARPSRRRGSGDEIASSRPYRRGDPSASSTGPPRPDCRRRAAPTSSSSATTSPRMPSGSSSSSTGAARWRSSRLAPVARQAGGGARGGRHDRRERCGDERPDRLRRGRRGRCAGRSVPARSRPLAGDRAAPRTAAADGPPDSLDRALALLSAQGRTVPPGTFVFVLSDFLPPPSAARLDRRARGRLGRRSRRRPGSRLGALVPGRLRRHAAARRSRTTGTPSLVRLSRKEARARRDANEQRAARLDDALLDLGLDPVTITSSDRGAVHAAFLAWAERRRTRTRGYR